MHKRITHTYTRTSPTFAIAHPDSKMLDAPFFSFIKSGRTPSAAAIKLPKNAALATSKPSNTDSVVPIIFGSMNPILHVKKIRDNQWVRFRVLPTQESLHDSEPPKHMPAKIKPTRGGTLTTSAATAVTRAKAVIKVNWWERIWAGGKKMHVTSRLMHRNHGK